MTNPAPLTPRRLEAVIFDWAGTVVDFGSFAPTQILVDTFKAAYGFDLSLAEARRPMGLGKWQHIEALGRDEAVGARWQARFGHPLGPAEVQHLYETFVPLQIERVAQHCALIPGTLAVVAELRRRGLRIGSTTGYPRAVMARLLALAAEQGYAPDCTVCADDLDAGARPGPWMALDCVRQLRVGAVAHCVKVDDTAPGIAEGRNAGMWSVGLALSGSPAGWTLAECQAASPSQREAVRARVSAELDRAGAHFVIDTVADLLPVLDLIGQRLRDGERP
jgi:phosphonoacetaldehyde hydrolase